ncbi:unnamed protein product [Rodentolepis nana]|uniref:Protein tweety homolog n=1 Tax=Rodentolepis nana TaxID=102285 RepID=A0A0R3TZ97_RODNA|nr:unnamed protein product [Rodentolepis nana]
MYTVGLLLLGIVSVSVKWMVRSENGGLLNVIFQIKSQNPTHFQLAPTSDFEFYKNLILFKPQSLSLLDAIPEELGGGQKGVKHSHDNPNLEAITLWLTIGSFSLLCISLFLALMRPCCRSHQGEEEVDSVELARQRNQSSRKILIGASICIIPGLLCLLFFYFSSMNLLIEALGTSPRNQTNGSDSVSIALFDQKSKDLAVQETIKTFKLPLIRHLIQTTINSSRNGIDASEWRKMTHIYDNLMTSYSTVLSSIDTVATNLERCNNRNCPNTKVMLKNLRQRQEKYFKSLYKSQENAENLTDVQRKTVDYLRGTYRLIYKLEKFAYHVVNSTLDQTTENEIISDLDRKWKNFSTYANTTLQYANTHVVNSIKSDFKKIVPPAKTTLYSIGVLLVLTLLVFIGLVVNSITQASRIHNESENGLYSETGKHGCCVVYCLSVLFLLMSVAVSVVVGMSLFGLSVLLGEGCTYIMKETGYNKTDHILNGLGDDYWETLLMKYSDKWLNKSIFPPPKNIIRALSKVCKTENGEIDKSLLFALGYRSTSIDFKTLLSNPKVDEMVKGLWDFSEASRQIITTGFVFNLDKFITSLESLDTIDQLFNKHNMTSHNSTFSITPSESQQLLHHFQGEELNNLNSTIQYINAMAIIMDEEISKIKMELRETWPDVEKVLHAVSHNSTFSITPSESQQLLNHIRGREVNNLNSAIQYINAMAITMDEEILKIKMELRETWPDVEKVLHAVSEFRSLIVDTKKLERKFEGMSDKLVLEIKPWLVVQATAYLDEFTKRLIPCGEAHKAFYVVTEATCGETGLLHRFTAYVCILGINVFCQALFALIFLLLNSSKTRRG